MSQFNQQILAAKKKQRLAYFRVLGLFILAALAIFAAIVASRGSRIEIHPQAAAELASVQRDQGLVVVIGETLYSISKSPVIAVTAEGFKPLKRMLNENDFGKVISITMSPLPAKLELSTSINDEKTSWLINDEVMAVSASFEHELEAGDYQLTVTHPYYKDVSLTLSLARDQRFKKLIELSPINGVLSITTMPAMAQIIIDGTDKGLSPLDIPLQGGIHEVKLMLNNYQTMTDKIEINRNQSTLSRDYKLEQKKAAISVTLVPAGGRLFINNRLVKKTVKIPIKKAIKHRVSYSKTGYFTETQSITVNDDEIINLAFQLKKEMGLVDIKSSPEAEVRLNGKPVGNTPLQLSLNAIKQKITLHKSGFRSITKLITPSAASTKKISVSLVSEETARQKDTAGIYTHKAGGKLKLFRPNDSFTMGAKRSERGQRANEFVKKITLNKAFYAGITEVTNQQFRHYNKNKAGAANNPVTSVSWVEAAKFCNWLSQLEGLNPIYRFNKNQLLGINENTNGYRLLTEAEWEWLARKSAKSAQTLFVWGNEYVIPKGAVNIADESAKGSVRVFVSLYNDGFAGVAPVKSFTREKAGLYDQGGNVSEWTHDNYSIVLHKSGKVFTNPFDLSKGDSRVIKGANWRSGSVTELRASYREGLVKARNDLGFRIGRYAYQGK